MWSYVEENEVWLIWLYLLNWAVFANTHSTWKLEILLSTGLFSLISPTFDSATRKPAYNSLLYFETHENLFNILWAAHSCEIFANLWYDIMYDNSAVEEGNSIVRLELPSFQSWEPLILSYSFKRDQLAFYVSRFSPKDVVHRMKLNPALQRKWAHWQGRASSLEFQIQDILVRRLTVEGLSSHENPIPPAEAMCECRVIAHAADLFASGQMHTPGQRCDFSAGSGQSHHWGSD